MRLDIERSSGLYLGLILTVLTALTVLAFGLKKPYDNWDMVGYVAVAFHGEGLRGSALNEATYAAIRKDVDAATFNNLAHGDHYRDTVFSDPQSLEQQLPFYSIRMFYMAAIKSVHSIGVGYPRSISIVSAVFATLSVLLLAVIGRQADVPLVAMPLVVAMAGFIEIARLSTPDAMACFFALLAAYCLIRRSIFFFVVAALLPLVRTDFVLLSGLMLGYTYFSGMRARSAVILAATGIVYVLIVKTQRGYGWLTLFNTSLIAKTPYPATLFPSHAIGDYIRPYLSAAYGITMHPYFVIFGMAISWWLIESSRGETRENEVHYALLVIPLAFVALHVLLFPANTYRFFEFAASLVATWLLRQMRSSQIREELAPEPFAGKDVREWNSVDGEGIFAQIRALGQVLFMTRRKGIRK